MTSCIEQLGFPLFFPPSKSFFNNHCECGAVTPEAIKFVAVIYKLYLTVAIIYKLSLTVAVIYKLSLNVAIIYKLSFTCRHLHADHSGTLKTQVTFGDYSFICGQRS